MEAGVVGAVVRVWAGDRRGVPAAPQAREDPIGWLEIENEIDGDHPRGAGARSWRPEDRSLRRCELGRFASAVALLDDGSRWSSARRSSSGTARPAWDDYETVIVLASEEARASKKIKFLSIGRLLGEAIRRIHNSDSVSSLFV